MCENRSRTWAFLWQPHRQQWELWAPLCRSVKKCHWEENWKSPAQSHSGISQFTHHWREAAASDDHWLIWERVLSTQSEGGNFLIHCPTNTVCRDKEIAVSYWVRAISDKGWDLLCSLWHSSLLHLNLLLLHPAIPTLTLLVCFSGCRLCCCH